MHWWHRHGVLRMGLCQVQFETQAATIRYFDYGDIFFITTLKGVNVCCFLLLHLEASLFEVVWDIVLHSSPVLFTNIKYLKV
jgi:hypothetical protein